jgi:nucleoside-diphosphate-sugar epimerase
MNILVTGATGFIGSAFIRHALSQDHTIAALTRTGITTPPTLPRHDRLKLIAGSLTEPPLPQLKHFKADACVHLAWITTPGIYLESPENKWFRDASLSFLRTIHELGTNHIVGVGTCIEYQITGEPLSEERTPIAPPTTYARCKNELRLALEAEALARGFALAWGRVFYPYGPGEHPDRLCSSIIRKLSRNESVILKTPDSVKDYIYIDDLASAILRTVETRFKGTINWGTGVGVSVREVADTIATSVGRPDLIVTASTLGKDTFDSVVANSSRLRQLGWTPQMNLKEGTTRLRNLL